MKYFFFVTLSVLSVIVFPTASYGLVCATLEQDKAQQLKRLEVAKDKIFTQDETTSALISQKKMDKIESIHKKTSARIEELNEILRELQKIENPSLPLIKTTAILETAIKNYSSSTIHSLNVFDAQVDTILLDKTKHIRTVVFQYENGVAQLYENSTLSCRKNSLNEVKTFSEDLKLLQKRVTDAEKHSKRILQGIDAAYAKLALELDQSDAVLSETLKTIQKSILENSLLEIQPLSLVRLWKML